MTQQERQVMARPETAVDCCEWCGERIDRTGGFRVGDEGGFPIVLCPHCFVQDESFDGCTDYTIFGRR